MNIKILNDRIVIIGHQPTEVLCAGLSGIISPYMIYYPDYCEESRNDENRANDTVTIMDNGSDSYQMIKHALINNDVFNVEYNGGK